MKITKEAVLTLVVSFDPQALDDVNGLVDEARGFGTIISATVKMPETELDVSGGR